METPYRIEPTRLHSFPERLVDSLAEVTRISARLSQRLHPATAAGLAELLRLRTAPNTRCCRETYAKSLFRTT